MRRPAPFDLDALTISTPCTASWDAMSGDDRRRFCGRCRLHVYDLSALTRREARTLLAKGEGRVCVRLHRRPDGRVVTRDCGRVRLALARRLARVRAAAAALLAMLGLAGCGRDAAAPPPAPTTGEVAAPPRPPVLMGTPAVEERPPEPTVELGGVRAPWPERPEGER